MILTLLTVTLLAEPVAFPKFDAKEIAKDLKIGYAVHLVDINRDNKLDIVVVDQDRVVWYENPTWKARTITSGKTKPDNVCITSAFIDGDQDIDLVLGAGWKPSDTTTPGSLYWLSRGKTIDDEWTLHPIPCDEPTVHRIATMTLEGVDGMRIVMAPLQGRGSSAKGNWTDGRPCRILAYPIPKDPTKPDNWKPEVINESLHVVHNFTRGRMLWTASYEGVGRLTRESGSWTLNSVGSGDQTNPNASRGSSEIAISERYDVTRIATIEPWHGNSVAMYSIFQSGSRKREVIDTQLRWGHAISFADLDGDRVDELIVGVRDNPDPKKGDTFTEKRGVRIYKNTDGKGTKWERMLLDPDGVAVEDLAVGDLNGDGKPDIVAVGRATKNCKIYFNLGK